MEITKESICSALSNGKFEDLANKLDQLIDQIKLANGSLFLIKSFDKIHNLREGWDNAQTIVAAAIQANIELIGLDSSLAWDMYLIFFCEETVDYSLKQSIERDKFCCKKYVFQTSQETSPWEVIENKMPLLYKWSQDTPEVFISPGGNIKHVREKLTEGNETALSILLRNEDYFAKLSTSGIIESIVNLEDTTAVGGDSHE